MQHKHISCTMSVMITESTPCPGKTDQNYNMFGFVNVMYKTPLVPFLLHMVYT